MNSPPDPLVGLIQSVRYRPECVDAVDSDLRKRLAEAGWSCRAWTDPPGTTHSPHDHPYSHRVLCASGWIEFSVGEDMFRLTPGDALDLPEGVTHGARTSPDGPTEYWLLRPDRVEGDRS